MFENVRKVWIIKCQVFVVFLQEIQLCVNYWLKSLQNTWRIRFMRLLFEEHIWDLESVFLYMLYDMWSFNKGLVLHKICTLEPD